MAGFFSTLVSEQGARRRRLRASMGDRGQGIIEFLTLGGLVAGSLGLLLGAWMPAAAPWGFALPVVFAIGFVLLERRRQAALTDALQRVAALNDGLDQQELSQLLAEFQSEPDLNKDVLATAEANFRANTAARWQQRTDAASLNVSRNYDWLVVLWSLGCALAGAAAFVIAWSAQPAPHHEDETWRPPASAVPVDISPPSQ
jgi:hypothetical protein